MVFAVADGMGGHAAGEVASRIVVDALDALVEQPPSSPDDVADLLRDANRRILDSQADSPEQRGMGTTVAGLTVVDAGGREHWVVFNIGDSRVYRLADNRMSLVTRDHSEVRELMDAGLIDANEAARHPLRNVITRSLGSDPAPSPDVWVLPPTPGERFVICSDGLSGELDDREIMLVARKYADPQIAADQLRRGRGAGRGPRQRLRGGRGRRCRRGRRRGGRHRAAGRAAARLRAEGLRGRAVRRGRSAPRRRPPSFPGRGCRSAAGEIADTGHDGEV